MIAPVCAARRAVGAFRGLCATPLTGYIHVVAQNAAGCAVGGARRDALSARTRVSITNHYVLTKEKLLAEGPELSDSLLSGLRNVL